jgi:C1A family cysteine protease
MAGKRYYFCMTDSGQCYQTNGPFLNINACKTYIVGKYGKRTYGYCYEEKAECTKNCKVVGEKPPAEFTGEKFYVCMKATGKCSVTYQYQGYDLRLCADAVNKNMPGKTSGRCYKDIEDCSIDCMNGVEEAPIQANGLPTSFDWRNYKKQNWLTAVKNQGTCGGCWAFAGAATVESQYNIEQKMANLDINLSEQDIISCSGEGSCQYGGPDAGALDAFKTGIVDEQCFPYIAAGWKMGDREPQCNKCVDAASRQWRIGEYGFIEAGSMDNIKKALSEKGPLLTSMFIGGKVDGQWVKVDFSKPVLTCSRVGNSTNHTVVVVGYDDKEQAWIVRNSWGANWPNMNSGGYFKVAYGSCAIFSEGAYYVQQVAIPK